MASKQNGNSIAAPRPPFRRQGSSIGAGPHPMAVALAPVHRIDYSVTKGGARTWAVLLVFLFLCSGLYTIFSSKDLSEGVDTDDDEDTETQPLEDQLFAGLRRKIENNIKRVKSYVKEKETIHEAQNEDDYGEPQLPQKRTKRKKQKEARVKVEVPTQEQEDDVVEPSKEEHEADKVEKAPTDTDDQRHHRRMKTHGFRHLMADSVPERECKRKHCPPSYGAGPRISLLKRKNKGSKAEVEDDEGEEIALTKQRTSGREAYRRQAITNRDDHKNRDALDRADNLVEKHDYNGAFAIFNTILRARPDSPRAHFGKGRGYELRGELTSSDRDFSRAIHEYEQVLDNEETPDALFRQAASRLIELSSFRGDFYRSLLTHRMLVSRFPDEVEHQTNVALTFIKMKRLGDAKKVLHDIIESDHNNGVALAYYGYILKVAEDNVEQGVAYMKKGLRLGGDSITDAKFYYHLGHGLMFLGRSTEAYSVFEHAASLGLFLSAQQRSMYNVEGLTGRAWWTSEQTGYSKYLKAVERQWVSIRAEAARLLQSVPYLWKEENPAITVDGRWIAFPLLENGHFNTENCRMAPQTCSILKEFRESSNASKSEMRFSALSSGAQILPHCGPTNSRLQAHLGLIVPSEARIRVGNEQRGWKTGKFIIFDDSFEHELQFDGASSASLRLILLIDLWHPEVESRQRTAPEDD
ncbi:tetratricopeptide repeat protein [Ostertagia ostertagi]